MTAEKCWKLTAEKCMFLLAFYRGKKQNQLFGNQIRQILDDFTSEIGICKRIAYQEIEKSDYSLLPQRYLTLNSYENVVSIDEISREIARGISLSSEEMDQFITKETTDTDCILPACISNGIISNLFYFRSDLSSQKMNFAYPGDLLINKSGSPFRTAVSDGFYLVVGNVYVVRVKDGYDPYYLKCFLESEKGQAEFMKYATGSGSPVISITNLRKMQIPIFHEEKQKELEATARECTIELKRALQQVKLFGNSFEE